MKEAVSIPMKNHYEALAHLYHSYFTGGLLFLAMRRGPASVCKVTFNLFRRQHNEKFLSSFEKLGLRDLPDAVACAQYHYLSNGVGGVGVSGPAQTLALAPG